MEATSLERLQKVLAAAGVGSRRKCEELIGQGRVRVDGIVATLGCKVDRATIQITLDGRILPLGETKRYIVLHKPAGILTVMDDERGRKALS
ncbi:MAG TPA: S4 domain-containing protein, partial [Anaerolineae bacterium]|nr:S4 domain-containing protein [Anaerolineae bacterium]